MKPIKPNVQVFNSFSKLIEDKTEKSKEELKNIKKSLKKDWSQPEESKETSCLDIENIPKKFNREDCQKAYTEYLQGKRIPVDATVIKFQNGFISAEEQAYRLRHVSTPRALSMGYMESMRWARGNIKEILMQRINVWSIQAEKSYKDKFERS